VGDDQDDLILMPYTTARKRLQGSEFDNVNAIMVSAVSPVVMSDAEAEINALLAERHRIQPGDPPDFQVQNTTEIANVLGVITGTLTVMLSSIAGISLVVGGVVGACWYRSPSGLGRLASAWRSGRGPGTSCVNSW